MKRVLKITGGAFLLIVLLLTGFVAYVRWGMAPDVPVVQDKSVLQLNRQAVGENFYRIGNNWLRKSKSGLWEEYVEGEPFERGVVTGKLNKELMATQESYFIAQIHQLVPNNNYLKFLRLLTLFFNRNLSQSVPEENRLEIYGESLSAPHEYDYVGGAYERMLNYHAAHDIGHMMQNFALVGCTSFSAWGDKTSDSTLLIARNCDFFVGDNFAKDKIIYFCNPSQGHKFAFVTWGGMMGCLSGMNERGLTVTINAAKSDLPTGSAMPISLLAREILQYAGNIDEAYAIAKKRKTFVAESIMIGSAADHKTALLEKSPAKLALYYSGKNYLMCANHFQSDIFKHDENNLQNIATSASMYRYGRLQELMNQNPKLDYLTAASILRDQKGQHEKNIGIGNEKAINQLICHHSIIFEPEKLKFWVTTSPYQLGEFICYDLKKVFADAPNLKENKEINEAELTIPTDTFLSSPTWQKFLQYRDCRDQIKHAIDNKLKLSDEKILTNIVADNPEYWESYYWVGRYYEFNGNKAGAKQFYEKALTKEVNDKLEVDAIHQSLKKLSAQ